MGTKESEMMNSITIGQLIGQLQNHEARADELHHRLMLEEQHNENTSATVEQIDLLNQELVKTLEEFQSQKWFQNLKEKA